MTVTLYTSLKVINTEVPHQQKCNKVVYIAITISSNKETKHCLFGFGHLSPLPEEKVCLLTMYELLPIL